MAAINFDKTDRKILAILQEDGRLTNQEVAERVNLSPSPCLRRIKRLEEAGVIRQYVALLAPEKIGGVGEPGRCGRNDGGSAAYSRR